MNAPATIVFVALFLLVTVIGFVAAHWRKADLNLLHEWGLGGRRFGTMVTWFLLGGDLYTAYTFIAVPALVYGKGAIGFFAIPYAILLYPILMWSFRGSGRWLTRAAISLPRTSCASASTAAYSRSPWR